MLVYIHRANIEKFVFRIIGREKSTTQKCIKPMNGDGGIWRGRGGGEESSKRKQSEKRMEFITMNTLPVISECISDTFFSWIRRGRGEEKGKKW